MMFCNKEEPYRMDSSRLRHLYKIPEIVEVPVYIKTQGKYRTSGGRARGCVVHYTAGRSLEGAKNAISTLTYLASRGLGCLVMDSNGIIYRAKNHDLHKVGFHAGKSSWLDQTSISYHCIGMELCCAGKLDQSGTSWFNESYNKSLINEIKVPKDNQKVGKYHKYTTTAQEFALTNFLLWQLDVNPDFQIQWIVGHDEISPDRKSDPGGSLSITMPELREYLKAQIAR